jgi:glycosyltransferase involved in cell wall biosynthesis
MTKVLVLSAHQIQLDRRIVAEMNALVESGREVTLVSVPVAIPVSALDDRIRTIVPDPTHVDRRKSQLKSWIKGLPEPAPTFALLAGFCMSYHVRHDMERFFLRKTPQEHFDVIHCHDLPTLPAALKVRSAVSPGAKVIYDSHELFPQQFRSRAVQILMTRLEQQHVRQADRVITVNESIADHLAETYEIPRPEVIYNSFDVAASRPCVDETVFLNHFSARPEGFRVIFQGNLSWERNLRNLVLAFGMLDESINLFILGSGQEESVLKALCQSHKHRNVFFGPWVPQELLAGYLAHVHMGIIPYLGTNLLNNIYCTPNKLFEFMELGIPTCASDLPELRKIVKGFGIGCTYKMDAPIEIAQAVKDCMQKCNSGEFKESSFEGARAELGWPKQSETLLRLYDELGV